MTVACPMNEHLQNIHLIVLIFCLYTQESQVEKRKLTEFRVLTLIFFTIIRVSVFVRLLFPSIFAAFLVFPSFRWVFPLYFNFVFLFSVAWNTVGLGIRFIHLIHVLRIRITRNPIVRLQHCLHTIIEITKFYIFLCVTLAIHSVWYRDGVQRTKARSVSEREWERERKKRVWNGK